MKNTEKFSEFYITLHYISTHARVIQL